MIQDSQNYSRGISLLLTIFMISILLAMSLGLSTILLQGIKMVRGTGDSVIAFYAADTGIERTMVGWANPPPSDIPETTLDNEARYRVFVYKGPETPGGPAPECTEPGLYYCIKSVGFYNGTKRAIEIDY